MKTTITLALLGIACGTLSAQALLLTGSVEKITLYPRGSQQCPEDCPPTTVHPDGSTSVCVSNACGCQVADVRIDQVLIGSHPDVTFQAAAKLGE